MIDGRKTMIDKHILYQFLQDGYTKMKEGSEAAENAKRETLRGGSGGCITKDGKVIGNDPRKVLLRYFGVQTPVGFNQQLMFDAGLSSEDNWTALLDHNQTSFKCEEEIPMRREIDMDGKKHLITGRPDIVVGDESDGTFTPSLGVELKLICSVHTLVKVANFADNKPKSDNVIQSAIYADHFDVPWVLAYTSRVNWAAPYYAKNRWTFDHDALKKDDKGNVYNITPFISLYDLWFEGDVLMLDGEPTAITRSGILRYYKYLAYCADNRVIPDKRTSRDHMGQPFAPNKNENIRYYDFKDEVTNQGFDTWLESCRKIVAGMK